MNGAMITLLSYSNHHLSFVLFNKHEKDIIQSDTLFKNHIRCDTSMHYLSGKENNTCLSYTKIFSK
jgi:hypothetical protein